MVESSLKEDFWECSKVDGSNNSALNTERTDGLIDSSLRGSIERRASHCVELNCNCNS